MILIFVIEIVLTDGNRFGKTFGSGGMAYNANFLFIGNTFIPFFVEIFDVNGIVKRLERWFLVKSKLNSKEPVTVT